MFALEDIEEAFKTRFAYVLSSEFPNDPQIYTRKKIIPVSMKKDFAQIYKDGITRASKQYNAGDWVVAQPKAQDAADEEAQEEVLENAA